MHPEKNYVLNFLNLRQEVCKQQQQDGDDNMVVTFILTVQHLLNTVHQLWLHVSTKLYWCKHRVQPSSSYCSPALCWLRTWCYGGNSCLASHTMGHICPFHFLKVSNTRLKYLLWSQQAQLENWMFQGSTSHPCKWHSGQTFGLV